MFDEFRDLPVHPLIVHATVVLLPLTALLGVLFIVPRLRGLLRWPLLAGALISLGLLFVTRESGEALEQALNLDGSAAVERHQDLATQLIWITVAFAAIVVVAVLVTRPTQPRTPTRTETSSQSGNAVVQTLVAVLVLVAAVAVGVQTARVGEAGSRAVWNPSGDTNFNTD